MIREDNFAKLRHYRVECYEEPSEEQKAKGSWGKHHHVGIVCRTADEAIAVVKGKYPTYRIDAVNQCGVIHHGVMSES